MNKTLCVTFLALIALNAACARPHEVYVDEVALPYVISFELAMNVRNTADVRIVPTLPSSGTTLPGTRVGVCVVSTVSTTVYLLASFWYSSEKERREQLVYHELGHCNGALKHDNSTMTINGNPVPASIMNQYIIDKNTYVANRAHYMADLKAKFGE